MYKNKWKENDVLTHLIITPYLDYHLENKIILLTVIYFAI